MSAIRTRAFAVEDISVRSGGTGRTVEAYAAVFDVAVEVRDRDGVYIEKIGRGAFDKTLSERKTPIPVFYNHGRLIDGSPSETGKYPIGVTKEIRPDSRGLYTRWEADASADADRALDSIKSGAVAGQSFSGRFLQSTPSRRSGRLFGPDSRGKLPTVVRTEIALAEYGPTPTPVYAEAEILGVRSMLQHLAPHLSREERAAMLAALEEEGIDTPDLGAVADEPRTHSTRLNLSPRSMRIMAALRTITKE